MEGKGNLAVPPGLGGQHRFTVKLSLPERSVQPWRASSSARTVGNSRSQPSNTKELPFFWMRNWRNWRAPGTPGSWGDNGWCWDGGTHLSVNARRSPLGSGGAHWVPNGNLWIPLGSEKDLVDPIKFRMGTGRFSCIPNGNLWIPWGSKKDLVDPIKFQMGTGRFYCIPNGTGGSHGVPRRPGGSHWLPNLNPQIGHPEPFPFPTPLVK